MTELDAQYNATVNEQRNYLMKLQEAFNRHCDEIAAEAQKKIAALPEKDLESRKAVFEEQKKRLEEALLQLRKEADASHLTVRKKLETIFRQKEEGRLAQLEQLMAGLK